MKREERIIYNQLKKEVTPDTISIEIPVTYSHEARQAMHELLTIEKGMCALCIYWNNILDVYAVHYEFANDIFADKRRNQENRDIDDVTAELPHHDYTWTGFPKPAQVDDVEEAQQMEEAQQQPEQTADDQQNEMEEKKMMFVNTAKIKANGTKFHGFFYTVDVTDGRNIASFISDGADHIDFAHLGSVLDENGVKYIKDEGHKLYLMPTWYKGGDVAEQEARMLDFIDRVLSMAIEVVFAEDEGELLYTV